jgi:NAD(P)-dependent dehydrogenase (short-subunit alcohol dehydrogenase family)
VSFACINYILMKLRNKTALITGGTSGIGLATAKDFISEGAKVIITGRNESTVRDTVAQLGANSYGIVCDNGNMENISHLKARVAEIAPSLDIVFANAGYGKFAPFEDVPEALFDELFAVLFKGTYFTLQAVLPMISNGGSVIVNTSVTNQYGSANSSLYSPAKAALKTLVQNLAAELASKNIRINAISPGYTETDAFTKTGMSPEQIAGIKDYVKTILPFGRFGEAGEIAKTVTFLGSDNASYIHGTEIVVDGGYTAIR